MAELPKAQPQGMPSGRTSRLEPPANDLFAIHPASSGKRLHEPCRPFRERKLGDQTKDDIDKEPREERSCGRSQTWLYNGVRTHRSLNKDAPVSRPLQLTGISPSHPILGGLGCGILFAAKTVLRCSGCAVGLFGVALPIGGVLRGEL